MMCVCIIYPVAAALSLSQTDDFKDPNRWTLFTTQSGLPSNVIQDIEETSDSTLWVVAHSLAWFDGFQWMTMDSSHGLPASAVVGTNMTLRDNILAQCALPDGGCDLYVGNTSGFGKIEIDLENPNAVSLDSETFLVASKYSLYSYRRGSLLPYEPLREATRNKTSFITQTANGAVWINLESGLYRWDGQKWEVMIEAGSFPLRLHHVAENRAGSGIAHFEIPREKSGMWEWSASSPPKRSTSERADAVIALDIGPHGEAIAVYRTGDIRWRENGVWRSVPSLESRVQDVTAVKFRSNGDLLFGTRHGLFLFNRSASAWDYLSHPPLDPRNTVNEILIARDGNLWIASKGGVECRFRDGSYRYLNRIRDEEITGVTGLAEDAAGNIWIGSGSAFTGTYRFDGHRWEHIPLRIDAGPVFVHKIRTTRSGGLMFLGLGKQIPGSDEPGVFECVDDSVRRWTGSDSLLSRRVYDFAEGLDGSYWFGTLGGVSRWKPSSPLNTRSSPAPEGVRDSRGGGWTHWTKSNGLKDPRITSLASDADGGLWFGSNAPPGPAQSFGVGRIDTLGRVRYVDLNDGLVGENVWDLKVDSAGRLWVATTSGLGLLDHGRWLRFDRRSGLSFVDLWPVLPSGGRIFVGTKGKGVAILNLEGVDYVAPRVLFEKPIVEGSSVRIAWKAATFWGELNEGDAKTSYRINDGDWSPWQNVGERRLDNLAPGEYRLQVRAQGRFGQYDPSEAGVSFAIPPPLYLRPGFYYPVGSSLGAVIALLILLQLSRARRRKELASSEAKFRAVATTTASAILVFHDDRFLFANHSAEVMTGYAQAELLSKSFWDLVDREGLAEVRAFMEDGLADTSRPRRFECQIVTKTNETKWLDVTASRIVFMKIPAVIVTAFDITKSKNAEDSLRESSAYNELILQSVPFGMDIVDTGGTILFASHNMEEMIGADLVGKKCWTMYKDDQTQCADCSLRAPFVHGETRKLVTENVKGGRTFEVYHTGMTYQGRSAVLEIFQDITERRLYEERLKDLASELTHTEERERRQMATFLHDSIGQQLAMAKMKLDALQEASTEDVASIMEHAQRLLQEAIQNTRSLTFDLSPPILFDLGLVPAIEWLVERMKEEKTLHVAFEDDGMAKPLSDDLRSVLFNGVREALVNVVKHAGARNVEIELKREGDQVTVTIEDDGHGIATDAHSGSNGFGLSNLRRRLTNLGGSASVEQRSGSGTRVVLKAPLAHFTIGGL